MATLEPKKSGFFGAVQQIEEHNDQAESDESNVPTELSSQAWQRKTYDGGVVYEGDFVGKKWHGIGKLTMTDGEEYTGMWKGATLFVVYVTSFAWG
jgi:hypothetical protein